MATSTALSQISDADELPQADRLTAGPVCRFPLRKVRVTFGGVALEGFASAALMGRFAQRDSDPTPGAVRFAGDPPPAGYGTPSPAPAERPPFASDPEPRPDAKRQQGR